MYLDTRDHLSHGNRITKVDAISFVITWKLIFQMESIITTSAWSKGSPLDTVTMGQFVSRGCRGAWPKSGRARPLGHPLNLCTSYGIQLEKWPTLGLKEEHLSRTLWSCLAYLPLIGLKSRLRAPLGHSMKVKLDFSVILTLPCYRFIKIKMKYCLSRACDFSSEANITKCDREVLTTSGSGMVFGKKLWISK